MTLTLQPFQVVGSIAVALTPEAAQAVEEAHPGAIGLLIQNLGPISVDAIQAKALELGLDLAAIPGVEVGFGIVQVNLGGSITGQAPEEQPAE